MFNNISWQGYWIGIALLTTSYYLVIYVLYFRKDFFIELGKQSTGKENGSFSSPGSAGVTPQLPSSQDPAFFNGSEEFIRPDKDTIESAVYTCIDEVNAYLEEVKKNKCIKEELLYALHRIVRKYPAIAVSEYKVSLGNVLVNQCEYHCSVHLSADEVAQVWVGG